MTVRSSFSMRGRLILSSLLLLFTSSDGQSSFIGRGRKLQESPCILVRVVTSFLEAGTLDESPIQCEMLGQDIDSGKSYFMPVNGLNDVQDSHVVSGETMLKPGVAMAQNGELFLPADAGIEVFENTTDDRRRLSAFGEKRVLVVRASANDASTSASKEELAFAIFGDDYNSFGDDDDEASVNLRSQYAGCSHGKLTFEPFRGETSSGAYVENGVIEVNVDVNVLESDRYTVERAMTGAAATLVGDLQQFDRVMLCLPPGSSSDSWVAYGYVNSWLTVFNDVWCERMSTQVHELGHTLNLGHSGNRTSDYGDKSCMMGYSFPWMERPRQCFNPAKNWQLGWYDTQSVEIDPLSDGSFVGTLIGVNDFDDTPSSRYVVLKIENGYKDLFVGYNRRKGINRGTQQGLDKVLIVEQGEGYGNSLKLAQLSVGEVYTVDNFRGSGSDLFITFTSVSADLDEAQVDVHLGS